MRAGERFDVLVIGGGPAGSAAATLLARAGWTVALAERKPFPRRKVCGEYLSLTNRPLLAELGILSDFDQLAGPPVDRVGLFAANAMLTAELPRPQGKQQPWGRALSRERLDTLLLHRAAAAGVCVYQPCSVRGLERTASGFRAELDVDDSDEVEAGLVIAAHGSWDVGSLPTQAPRHAPRHDDLIGFKAHFRQADLPAGLMPLLTFPGGYGGMVACDDGRISLSCCVRRDLLQSLREVASRSSAGETVLDHIRATCGGARAVLRSALRDGDWLAAGPIRPGFRLRWPVGIFAVGNAAGEAHPAIAEGMSMALQSAWLLTRRLAAWRQAGAHRGELPMVAADYAAAWRRAFAPRLVASAAVAHWAMRPAAVAGLLPLLRRLPGLLTSGARWSGKARLVVR